MSVENDWRTEVALTPTEASLTTNGNVRDVLVEMIFWINNQARSEVFDRLGRHRRRLRTRGWRIYESGRMLPPMMLDYEVIPSERLIVILKFAFFHADYYSVGSRAEEESLPSGIDGSTLTLMEFDDSERRSRSRGRDRRDWQVCIDPAFETVGAALTEQVQRKLYDLVSDLVVNTDGQVDPEAVFSVDLALADDPRRITVLYRIDPTARRAVIVDVLLRC